MGHPALLGLSGFAQYGYAVDGQLDRVHGFVCQDVLHCGGERDGLWEFAGVADDEDVVVLAGAAVDVYAFGGGEDVGFEVGFVEHPLDRAFGGGFVEPGADVGEFAAADLVGDGGGLAVPPGVGGVPAHEDLDVVGGRGELLGEE